MSTKDKIVLVTGASRGIGFAIARALKPDAEKLFLVARTKKSFDKTCDQFKKKKTIFLGSDLSSEAQIDKLVAQVKKETSRLDVLVNNAGVYLAKKFEKTTRPEINQQIAINLKGMLLLTQGLLPLLKKGKKPQIINISSIAAKASLYGESIYSATKAGVTSFSEVIRKELNPQGVRVTTIHPWGVNTWNAPNPQELLRPEDIGELVSFIVNTHPGCQIESIDCSSVFQWKGEKPPWIPN